MTTVAPENIDHIIELQIKSAKCLGCISHLDPECQKCPLQAQCREKAHEQKCILVRRMQAEFEAEWERITQEIKDRAEKNTSLSELTAFYDKQYYPCAGQQILTTTSKVETVCALCNLPISKNAEILFINEPTSPEKRQKTGSFHKSCVFLEEQFSVVVVDKIENIRVDLRDVLRTFVTKRELVDAITKRQRNFVVVEQKQKIEAEALRDRFNQYGQAVFAIQKCELTQSS